MNDIIEFHMLDYLDDIDLMNMRMAISKVEGYHDLFNVITDELMDRHINEIFSHVDSYTLGRIIDDGQKEDLDDDDVIYFLAEELFEVIQDEENEIYCRVNPNCDICGNHHKRILAIDCEHCIDDLEYDDDPDKLLCCHNCQAYADVVEGEDEGMIIGYMYNDYLDDIWKAKARDDE